MISGWKSESTLVSVARWPILEAAEASSLSVSAQSSCNPWWSSNGTGPWVWTPSLRPRIFLLQKLTLCHPFCSQALPPVLILGLLASVVCVEVWRCGPFGVTYCTFDLRHAAWCLCGFIPVFVSLLPLLLLEEHAIVWMYSSLCIHSLFFYFWSSKIEL